MNKAPEFLVNNQIYNRKNKPCEKWKNQKNLKSVKIIVKNGAKILNYCKRCNKIIEDCKCVKLYINQIVFKSSKKVNA